MTAHRRIDARWRVESFRADHLLVQGLPHAVQALEFEPALIAGHDLDRSDGVGVVGGKLWIEQVALLQQCAGTGQVGHVGIDLAGENRVVVQALFLRAFDFRVPVGALDQPHGNLAAAGSGQFRQPVNHVQAPFLIGLNHQAEAVVIAHLFIHFLEHQ